MRIALLAPTNSSLYSRLLAERILRAEELELEVIVVRRMISWKRLRGELRRDGPRLVQKITQKLVLGEERKTAHEEESLAALARQLELSSPSLQKMAKLHGVPFLVAPDHNHPRVEARLRDIAPDVIVFSGGGLIRKNILSIPQKGILNCHAGLLPPYRGMDVVEWAVLEAEAKPPQIGLTCHFMDKGVDTGPILQTHPLQVRKGDNFTAIRRRLQPLMVQLMMSTLVGLEQEALVPQPQAGHDGRQYFVMHPRMKQLAAFRLDELT